MTVSAGSPVAKEKRRSYRVRYPLELRPQLDCAGVPTAIVDISESGIRFVNRGGIGGVGEVVRGVVRFRCGSMAQVSGRVVRADGGETAVSLLRDLSFSMILREQRELRAHQKYSH